jgi:hypothetical protein
MIGYDSPDTLAIDADFKIKPNGKNVKPRERTLHTFDSSQSCN